MKTELKKLIVEECDLTVDPGEIGDDEPLFGREAKIALDSIDALQISIALEKKYKVTITDSKETRRMMRSINTFADFIQPE
ncbi:MAG: phosphopantetheine-binding protein [Syntrophus sp. (in: bacteria)]